MELCTDKDASDIKEEIDNVQARHGDVKAAIRGKLNQLDDAFRNISTDVNDTVDGLLEELHYLQDQMVHADPVSANPDTLKNQIAENQTVLDDLERKEEALQHVKEEVARALELESPETAGECEDLCTKLQDLDKLHQDIQEATTHREQALNDALNISEKFRRDHQGAMQALRDIQDNLHSQDSPGVDPSTVFEQQKELQAILEELHAVQEPITDCQATAEILGKLCGLPGNMEIEVMKPFHNINFC
jgi:dystonin